MRTQSISPEQTSASHQAQQNRMKPHTNSHNHQESRHEPSQLHNAAAATVHEIILRLRLSAEPIGHRCDYVGCDDEEGEVVLEEGGGEDDEEEADC